MLIKQLQNQGEENKAGFLQVEKTSLKVVFLPFFCSQNYYDDRLYRKYDIGSPSIAEVVMSHQCCSKIYFYGPMLNKHVITPVHTKNGGRPQIISIGAIRNQKC